MNKAFKDYLYKKDDNYEKILEKSNKKRFTRKTLLTRVAAIVIILFLVTATPSIYAKIKWNIEFREFKRSRTVSDKISLIIDENVDDGPNYILNSNPIEINGIKANVDSIVATDNNIAVIVTYEFNDVSNINSETFSTGFLIYDENKNVYYCGGRMHLGEKTQNINAYYKLLYDEIGAEFDRKDLFSAKYTQSTSCGREKVEGNKITLRYQINSISGYPKFKTLNIKLFDLGYFMAERTEDGKMSAENFNVSNDEWNFSIDMPQRFLDRTSVKLKVANNIEGLELDKFEITETGLNVVGTLKDFGEYVEGGLNGTIENWGEFSEKIIYITDEEGNVYKGNEIGTYGKENGFHTSFNNIGKDDLNKKLYLHACIGYEDKVEEIIIDN
ncbi:MAG: hypothetical protein IKN74_01450 [Clostridia bacterium]|nr:hypothetical protein [Clostridia bacterium]